MPYVWKTCFDSLECNTTRAECGQVINKVYDGSLKLFLAAFLEKEKLSQKDADELKKIIDENTAEGE